MLPDSRIRLLTYYSLYALVMVAILTIFTIALYVPFSQYLYRQLDGDLDRLARLAAPTFARVQTGNLEADRGDEFPWQEFFDPERQSLEWFDGEGKLLAARSNKIQLGFSPERSGGYWTLQGEPALDHYGIRTFTLPVSLDRSSLSEPPLTGFVRASETTERLQAVRGQFLGQLTISMILALGAVGISGLWLTKKALEPVDRTYQHVKQFTADASHELRNPLAAVQTSLDVMRGHPERFHEKDFRKLNAIASATRQMTDLTKDLLFLARVEEDNPSSLRDGRKIDLGSLLEDTIEWLEPLASEKSIRLDYECLAGVFLWGNPGQLGRLFGNLVENAIQYTPSRGFIRLRMWKENQKAIVTLEDTGIGIAPEHLEKVFDRFWRADRARAYREGGTGLGLAISLAIARQHGGQIQVTSQEGIGSCFRVSLASREPMHRPTAGRLFTRAIGSWPVNSLTGGGWKRKSALVFLIALLCFLPPWLAWQTVGRVSVFHGVYFPNGASSFPDEIVVDPDSRAQEPGAILGIPDAGRSSPRLFFDPRPRYATLRPGDRLAVRFTDNLLTGSGDSRPDLLLFSQGQASLQVEASKDGRIWRRIGTVTSGGEGLDIDRASPAKEDFFAYLRVIYPRQERSNAPFYIDSIGALSSVSLVRGDFESWLLSLSFSRVAIVIYVSILVIYFGNYWLKSIDRESPSTLAPRDSSRSR